MGYRVVVVGATGNVGREMLNILAERAFPVDEIAVLASRRSMGTEVSFGERTLRTHDLEQFDFAGWDIAFFAVGSDATKAHAPRAAKAGCIVIDNSSLYRYDPDVPLVVPEVNPEAVDGYAKKNIVANPNCSTAQMVVALKPLHDRARIRRVVVSTYQAVSGTGKEAIDELWDQTKGMYVPGQEREPSVYTKQIAFNVIPHCDTFMEDGSTREEWKLMVETKKILDRSIKVTATCVRVPGLRGPFGGDQRRVRGLPRRGRGARHPAPRPRRARRRQARGWRLRHAGRVRRRLRGLREPHPAGFDDRQRAEPLGRLRQPAQGRGAQRGADRRDARRAGAAQGRGRDGGVTARARRATVGPSVPPEVPMRSILVVLALLAAPASAEEFDVPARAVAATAYLQGIAVTRRATADLPAGRHAIRLPAMPGSTGTPRIAVAGASLAATETIADAVVDPTAFDTPAQARARAALDAATRAADAAADDRIRAAAAHRAAEDALAFVRSIDGASLGAVEPEAIGAMAAAVAGNATAAEIARADANAALRAARAAEAEARRALDQAARDLAATGALEGPVTLLSLSVVVEEAGPVDVTVEDFAAGGGWSMAYDVDLGADDAVTLTRRATVRQGTGLALDAVALTLSTADPYAQAAPTVPRPDLARALDAPPPPQVPIPLPQARMEAMAADAAPALVARADTDGPVVTYDVPVPVGLPVSGDPVTLALGRVDLAARVFDRASPRFDATAFRIAAVTNDTPEPLLAGPATLSREGRVVGETFLALLPAGDEAELSFGPVEQLRLEYRALGNETGDAGFLSVSGTRRQDLVFRVRNLSGEAARVETLFALPYSEQEDLEVRVEADPPPDRRDVDEARGVAAWLLDVPADGTVEVRIAVELRWPEGQVLVWEP